MIVGCKVMGNNVQVASQLPILPSKIDYGGFLIVLKIHIAILNAFSTDMMNGFSGEPVRMVAPVQESYYHHQEQLNDRVRADDGQGERGQETGERVQLSGAKAYISTLLCT